MALIAAHNVSIDIPIYDAGGGSIRKFLLGKAVGGQIAQQGSHVVVRALDDISFEAHDGDRIGLVGQNGAGKTTLLRVLCGTYPPTAGAIEVQGRVSPMLNNTLGMDGDATGFENIRICAMLRGMTQRQVDESMDDIVAFTELAQRDLPGHQKPWFDWLWAMLTALHRDECGSPAGDERLFPRLASRPGDRRVRYPP